MLPRKVKILERAETMGDGPTRSNSLGKTLRANSGPCNVVLRPFRMFSLAQRVQPATMIGFEQIEFFDHTGSVRRCADTWPAGTLPGTPAGS